MINTYTNQLMRSSNNPPAIDDNGGGNSMAFYNVQRETPRFSRASPMNSP